MALRCGIIGLTNIGKTTIFNCFSDTKAESTNFAFSTSKSNIGTSHVPDPRLYAMEKLQATEKIIPVTIEIVDIPGLAKGASTGEGMGNKFLADVKNVDALIHVVRCFDDENLPHIEGNIDPVRDAELVDFELQFKDLESIENRLERVKKTARTGDKEAKQLQATLEGLKSHLEEMQNIRDRDLDDAEQMIVNEMQLITAKPVMYVCNVEDESANDKNDYVKSFETSIKNSHAEMIVIAGALESEIAELEDEEDRLAFLEDAGLKEPGVNKLVRSAYSLLKLRTFFTVGPKEIHAWTLKEGMTAPQAAGVIHSDLERGFIRAEVMSYDEYSQYGSENAVKEAGKYRVEGKGYMVEDGDIIFVRFNV